MAKLTRQQLIDHLVGNCDCKQDAPLFNAESDLELLEGMSDEQLVATYHGSLSNNSEDDTDETEDVENMDEEEEMDEEDMEEDTEEEAPKGKGKFPFFKKKVANSATFNEDDLPEEIREDLQFARNMKRQQKEQLIAKITANEGGLFTSKELMTKSVDELTKIASLVGNSDNKGSSVRTRKVSPRVGNGQPVKSSVTNSDENDILDLPVMDYSDN